MANNHRLFRFGGFFSKIAGFVAVVALAPFAAKAEPIRLGWQTPWATQGQLVMALRHTTIPDLTDIELEYVGFSYGGPLNRAALAGQVDVLLTADQPALALMSRSPDYHIVARMMYNRVCLYVPPASPLETVAALAGGRVSGPVGAAAERFALQAMAEAGVNLSEVRFGSLDMARQTALISAARNGEWPGVDALYGFDPIPAMLETAGKVRMLDCGRVVSVVVASEAMLGERREDLEKFLRAFALAWRAFAADPERYNRLFAAASRLDASQETLDLAASVEPNRGAASMAEIRLDFTEDDHAILDQALAFLQSRSVIPADFSYEGRIRLDALNEGFDPEALEAAFQDVQPIDQ